MVAFVGATTPTVAAPTLAPSLSPVALSLSVIPQKLPADNNTYGSVIVSVVDKNALPTAALAPINAILISSQVNVGTISQALTIPAGSTYAIANFTTSNTPGSTTVTATAPGLLSASTVVTTVVAVGYPTHLVTLAVPNTVPARASNTGQLILELVDDLGLPAKAVADTPITLFSSNTNVVSLSTGTTLMAQGSYLLEVNYASSFVPGSATITASAPGFASGTATITVLGFPPLVLKLVAQPSFMVACQAPVTSCTGRLVVALTGLNGNPARATRDIQVQIRSSDLGIINAVTTTTIKAGNIEAVANYTVAAASVPPASPQLQATITASAPGLQSGFATIIITNAQLVSPTICTSGPQTICGLSIYAGPNPVLADHRSYSSVVVSLESNPPGIGLSPSVNATGPTTVTLTSSVTGIGNFTKITFTIPKGQNWAAVNFTSTFQVGATQLTASAQNMLPIQTTLGTFGPVPSQVVLQSISGTLPADGGTHPALELSLDDAFGAPAIAPFDLTVNLTSTHNEIVRVAPVVIPAGQTFAIVNVTAGIVPGRANITALESAFVSGVATSSTVLSAVIPAPSSLSSSITGGGKVIWPKPTDPQLPLAAVQLQDAIGNPARARAPLNITVTSSNSTVISKVLIVPVNVGQDYVTIPLAPAVPGTTTLTISSPGFSVSTLPVSFLGYPSQETISGGPAKIFTNQTSIISVSALLDGAPLAGANVRWTTTSGGLIIATPPPTTNSSTTVGVTTTTSSTTTTRAAAANPAGAPAVSDTTDKTGASTVVFKPNKAGTALISAVLSNSGLPAKKLNFTVLVTTAPPPVVKQQPGLLQQLTQFPMILLPAGGAGGVAIVAVLIIRRRSGRGGGGEDEFDTSFE